MKKNIERMLENAGNIQYFSNILNSCCKFEIESMNKKEVTFITWNQDGFGCVRPDYIWTIETWIFKFIVKNRKLKSGLSSPMARYYAYKYLEKH